LLSEFSGRGQDEGLGVGGLSVDELEDADRESGGLSSAGLGLGDCVLALHEGDDTLLLDDGRLFETVTENASQQVLLDVKLLEGFN